ncbi:TPA: hypothetical protein PXQ00_004108, partial [Yersinia enterocolitica]|nr:hypothetical protein [Yersinia enterocolitica]
ERDIVSFSLTRTNELLLRKQPIQKTQESIIEKKKSIPIIKGYAELQERDGPKLEKLKKDSLIILYITTLEHLMKKI